MYRVCNEIDSIVNYYNLFEKYRHCAKFFFFLFLSWYKTYINFHFIFCVIIYDKFPETNVRYTYM